MISPTSAPRRIRLSTAARLAAAVVAMAASIAPKVAVESTEFEILICDASASVGGSAAARRGTELVVAADGPPRLARVVFGEGAAVESGPVARGESTSERARREVGPHASDLAAGLRAAAALAAQSRDSAGRFEVRILTDRRITGDARERNAAAVALARAGCVRARVEDVPSVELPARVEALAGPGRVSAGSPFALEARGVAREGDVLRLSRAGVAIEDRTFTGEGPFRVAFARIEEDPGIARFTARIVGGDPRISASSSVVVAAPGRVLCIAPRDTDVATLAALGSASRLDPDVDAPTLASALAAHDVVVLLDVRRAEIRSASMASILRFVERGGGLVLVGGPRSFAPGGFSGSTLDAASPLRCEPPDSAGAFVYLGLDASGSMATPWDDGADADRDRVVRQAATEFLRDAPPDTVVALRRFAGDLLPVGAAAPVVSLEALGRGAAEEWVASGGAPGGATALVPPLSEALRAVQGRTELRRLVLLFTDGQTEETGVDVRRAAQAILDSGAALTFVHPGEGEGIRQHLAGTAARVVAAGDAQELAGLFAAELASARATDAVVADPGAPRTTDAGVSAGFPRGDAERMPVLRANRTWPAEDAVVLVSLPSLPLVAWRTCGAGRVVALATRPAADGWLDDLVGAEELFDRSLAVVTPAPRPGLRVQWSGGGGLLVDPGGADGARLHRLEGEDGAGVTRVTVLVPAEGGLLRALDPTALHGVDGTLRVVDRSGAVAAVWGLDRPAPDEYLGPAPADLGGLCALATSALGPRGPSAAPWMAAAAVALLLAGSFLSFRESAVKSRTAAAR